MTLPAGLQGAHAALERLIEKRTTGRQITTDHDLQIDHLQVLSRLPCPTLCGIFFVRCRPKPQGAYPEITHVDHTDHELLQTLEIRDDLVSALKYAQQIIRWE